LPPYRFSIAAALYECATLYTSRWRKKKVTGTIPEAEEVYLHQPSRECAAHLKTFGTEQAAAETTLLAPPTTIHTSRLHQKEENEHNVLHQRSQHTH